MLFVHALCLLCQQPEPAISIENPAAMAVEQVVTASLPLPRGAYPKLGVAKLGDTPAVCDVLLRWPDGSVKVAQIQARLSLPASSRQKLRVRFADPGVQPQVEGGVWVFADGLPLRSIVTDSWGRRFTTKFEPDLRAGPLGYLRRSPLVRVRRFIGRHVLVAEGQDKGAFLGLCAYLTTYRDERRAELTVVLDNGVAAGGAAAGGEDGGIAFGPVRFGGHELRTDSSDLKFLPRFRTENLLDPPVADPDGGYRQRLFGMSDQLYLGDRTAKAFRFDLFLDGPAVDDVEREAVRNTVANPVRAFAALDWVRWTRAWGVHGGPAPVVGEAAGLLATQMREWRLGNHFGPFGSYGDPRDAAVQGTPRNGPSCLHNVIRWQAASLLRAAEGMVLQHVLRPTPGYAPRLEEETAAFRTGMSAWATQAPHGFAPLDYEHFSVDLLFDYYWLTGDAFARDELARMGRGLRVLLDQVPFVTGRGEGWCMQAAVLIAAATEDYELLDWVEQRFAAKIQALIGTQAQSFVLRQPPHDHVLGKDEPFDMPWQMAAFVHGLTALHAATDDAKYADIAVATALKMAGVGWLKGIGPKYAISALDSTRYQMPVGFGPLDGTALMEIGAFVLAESLAKTEVDRSLLRSRADFLMKSHLESPSVEVSANRWFQIYLDRTSQAR